MRKSALLLPILFLFLFCCGCYCVLIDHEVVVTDTRYKPFAVWGRKPIEPGTMVFKATVEIDDDDCAFTGCDDIAALLFLEVSFRCNEDHSISSRVLEAYGGTGSGIGDEGAIVKGGLSIGARRDGARLSGFWTITVPAAREGEEPKTWKMTRTYIITSDAVYVQKDAVDPPTGHGIGEGGAFGGEAELVPVPNYLENVICGWYSDDGEYHHLPVKDISELPADDAERASEDD